MGNRETSKSVVVLGFGAAAISAVLALRGEGYAGPVVIVTDDDPEPYSPVLTSYYAGGRISRSQCNAWADADIADLVDDLVAHTRIRSIDASAHQIEADDGRRFGYSKLLIATGAHPVAPGFPAIGGYEPLVLRTMADAERLRNAIGSEGCRKVLISGTSMVGLKALEACLDQGVHVTMLGRSPHILRATAHPSIADVFERLLERRGVKLRLGQTAKRATRDGESRTCTVEFGSGNRESFDEIVLAQGVKPNLDFLSPESDDRERGLPVDPFMRTSLPDVFAAGDCARTLDLTTGAKRVAGLWQCAVQQGRCAGRTMAAELSGRKAAIPYPGFVPCNVIHVRDILFASAGNVREEAGKRIELRDGGNATWMLAWNRLEGVERLAGFNVVAESGHPRETEELNGLIGRYRSEIMRTYLDIGGSSWR